MDSAWLDRSVQLSELVLARGLTSTYFISFRSSNERAVFTCKFNSHCSRNQIYVSANDRLPGSCIQKNLTCVLHYKTSTKAVMCCGRNCWIQIILYGQTVRRGRTGRRRNYLQPLSITNQLLFLLSLKNCIQFYMLLPWMSVYQENKPIRYTIFHFLLLIQHVSLMVAI